MINLEDAAVASWPQGNKKPTTRQLHGMAGAGALGGAFWGFLFGLIFFVPCLGAAIGAGMGALTGSMADVGIRAGVAQAAESRRFIAPIAAELLAMSESIEELETEEAGAGTPGRPGRLAIT